MAGNFTYPGVYVQELASPVHSISGVATAITAFVGAAARGPVNEPVSISSVADYQRAFGGTGASPLDLAVSLFFQNGGGDAIVVRVAPKDAPISRAPDETKLGVLRALTPGAWGDKLEITIDQDNIPGDNNRNWYNLTVKDPTTSATERYVGIDLNADVTSARSLQRVLANSNLLAADPPPPPDHPATPSAPAPSAPTGGPSAPPASPGGGGGPATPTPPATPAGPSAAPGPSPLNLPLTEPLSVALKGGSADPAKAVDTPPTEADLLGDPTTPSGLYAIAKHNTFFNLLVLTPVGGASDVAPDTLNKAAKFALDHRAMLIADAPAKWGAVAAAQQGRDEFFNGFGEAKSNVAVYFPRITVTSSALGVLQNVGPGAAVAGVYATTDANRGVWKAPAGITAQLGGADISLRMSDSENGRLNPVAINCLRSLPVIGNVVWGARTAAGDDITGSQWKYVPIRRLALYIEESLYRGTQWVVFEPNDEPLWAQVRLNVGAFMHTLFRQGAFQGTTAKDAYFVKCDSNTNPQADINNGILNVIVGFAPLKPAEFVVIQIQQIAGSIEV